MDGIPPPLEEDPLMPSGKSIAWMVAITLATVLGLEHYRSRSDSARPMVRKVA